MTNMIKKSIFKHKFLKDVLICSLGAYGGPEAHYGVFTDQLVVKKKYLSEEELIELIALCSILPGPSSTQTIVAIGHKLGGPLLAFMTMIVWALPVLIAMGLLSFIYQFLEYLNLSQQGLRYIGPMAVGFIIVAAYRISKKVITDKLTLTLMLISAVLTYLIPHPVIIPTVLVLGGFVSSLSSGEKNLWHKIELTPPWRYLIAFGSFAIAGVILSVSFDNLLFKLFEAFYRYGYLVFGGGQVVVPVMYTELVQTRAYMTSSEFLTGYGLVQGLPGPMFSFSAYAGGLAARGHGIPFQILGTIIGGLGIFLPGLLLIFFVYPVWENLKKMKGIKTALKGITAVASGLIAVSAIVLMQKSSLTIDNFAITLITSILLLTKKIPAPIIVLLVLGIGFLSSISF